MGPSVKLLWDYAAHISLEIDGGCVLSAFCLYVSEETWVSGEKEASLRRWMVVAKPSKLLISFNTLELLQLIKTETL